MSVERTQLFARRGPREARVLRLTNGVIVSGRSFYQSAMLAQPGVLLMYTEGTLPLAAVSPIVDFVGEEAIRCGPVTLVNDAELYTFYECGVREAWAAALSRRPPIIRATHMLVTATMTAMSMSILRVATGADIYTYETRAEFEADVQKRLPTLELGKLEKRVGR